MKFDTPPGHADFVPLRTTCAVWLLAPLLLVACATTETTPVVPPMQTAATDVTMQSRPPEPPVEVTPIPSAESVAPISLRAPGALSQMLVWADRTRALPSTELSLEITRLIEIPDTQRVPANDLQLAIALGQTHLASDIPRAQAALQKLLSNQTEDARALHPLGRFVAARLAEQKRVEDLLEKQNQQVRDLQRRLDQLNERLEAMRAIERSMAPKK